MSHAIRFCAAVALFFTAAPALAQTYTAGADLFFFGDNTEFNNPFRVGDTTFGVAGSIFLDTKLNETVTIRGGFFGLGRFGSHDALEHAEPVIALRLTRGASRFVFGSLETMNSRPEVVGPDRETPHGLLPPLQEENLSFTRGQEMGLQWIHESNVLNHDAWINWQRLNTTEHRERFDAGYRSVFEIGSAWQLHGQWHVVHEGGQRFSNGAVSDSQAGAVGLLWLGRPGEGVTQVTIEGHAVGTRDVPDRAAPERSESGLGVFARGTWERGEWRTHLIVWRGHDTMKVEGDSNYLATRRDGTFFRGVRDYGEWGLTRRFRPAPGVHIFAAFRIHRVESQYEYSYRIAGRVRLRHVF
jgi:hypothetical protein